MRSVHTVNYEGTVLLQQATGICYCADLVVTAGDKLSEVDLSSTSSVQADRQGGQTSKTLDMVEGLSVTATSTA
jgi:hypothetical protein